MIKIPFPWFGGKSKAADLIWTRLGADCGNYVEPFFGSGAIWINRPKQFNGWSVVNDLDGNLANVWRAMAKDPDAVAEAACYPTNEIDLTARHLWLVNNTKKMTARLMADPDYFEPRTAGWWVWGCCIWIRGGWCSGEGPWHAEPDEDGIPAITNANAGTGVNRKLPHLGDAGKGVNRKLPHLGDAGQGQRLQWLCEWFGELSTKLADTRICCGDWERIMSAGTMARNGVCAVVLDPPYSQTAAVYAHDSNTVAHDVRRWCIANDTNPELRIALCGHEGEHNELCGRGWTVETWEKGGGYQGADDRERIWFSPACIPATQSQPELFLM